MQRGDRHEITWIGALGNEKCLDVTAKTLRACGGGKPGLRVKWVNTPRHFAFKQALDAGARTMALSRLTGYSIRDAQANGMQPSAPARGVDDIPF